MAAGYTPHERRSFSILTTSANRFMRAIHDRMPVILANSAEEDWLLCDCTAVLRHNGYTTVEIRTVLPTSCPSCKSKDWNGLSAARCDDCSA